MSPSNAKLRGARDVILAASVALAVALASVPAHAAPESGLSNPAAIEHFERAQSAFEDEDYAAAIPSLKAAYALEPNPILLYAWAQAERFDGSCKRALELYKRFLATNPADAQRQLAEANVVDCEAEIGAQPPETGPDDPDAPPKDPDGNDPKPKDEPTGKPWYKDWLAPVLAGSGLVVGGVGGALVALGVKQGFESPGAVTQQDSFDEADTARAKHTAGWVLVGIGGALVLGGAIRYALLARKSGSAKRKDQARARPAIVVGGTRSFGFTVRF